MDIVVTTENPKRSFKIMTSQHTDDQSLYTIMVAELGNGAGLLHFDFYHNISNSKSNSDEKYLDIKNQIILKIKELVNKGIESW